MRLETAEVEACFTTHDRRKDCGTHSSILLAGMGGQLTTTEIGIIGGALELTNKTALQRMVPLEKVRLIPLTDSLQLGLCVFENTASLG